MKTASPASHRQLEADGPGSIEDTIKTTVESVEVEDDNPWRPIDEAPHDRVIEGRFHPDEEVGTRIFWRASRRREGYRWVVAGVWHDASTAGAVQCHPIHWREYVPVDLHFEERGEPPEAA